MALSDDEIRMRCLEIILPQAGKVMSEAGGWEHIFNFCEGLAAYVKNGIPPKTKEM